VSFIDKAKAAAQQAANKVQEGIDDVQTSRDLNAAYGDLGRKAYELASAGALSHPELEPLVQRINELESHHTGGAATQPEQATDTTPPQSPA
jgi:hypothetical protein